jgi:hypothetical protein
VLLSAGAVFSLLERNVVPVDFAVTLVVIVAAWQVAHVYDASYWVNRNLLIIRNLERQFLRADDLRGIHYYFGRIRGNKMIEHFRIQFALGVLVAALALLYHAVNQGLPVTYSAKESFKALPYLVTVLGLVFVLWLARRHSSSYANLVAASPGAAITGDAGEQRPDATRPSQETIRPN